MDTNHALYFRKGELSMTTKTVWAAYFSATNTTKKVVTQIARRLSQQTA